MTTTDIVKQVKNGEVDFADKKLRSAYALNLCTVSVSQIIDYSDIVVLEQEYEAILNNLNIEQMPKDEALLNILKQLLDTITFFRIQEGDKEFIDREYQHKMKNAIWSAVPNFGLLVSGGNPFTAVMSLASQVGIGYMNYRKTKAENQLAYEKEMWQLHKAAIEQFNGLRRELFDTAWRLAETYEFPDSYRLTERQVKQYDEILMDPDPFRRYERLDTIKGAFVAYPPFWYFFGNTANDIAAIAEPGEAEKYTELAKDYYEIFVQSFGKCNLLRENQIASSCALEYITLLDENTDKVKIGELLDLALDMSGNANDVLQMCAFGYLKVSEFEKAQKLLRVIVNEGYNSVVNGQLLSMMYINRYLDGDKAVEYEYKQLKTRVDESYLYPLPENLIEDKEKQYESINSDFMTNQKQILFEKYGLVINMFQEKYRAAFNRCVPVPGGEKHTDVYFNESVASYEKRSRDGQALKEKHGESRYAEELLDCNYPYNYLEVLNGLYNDVCKLSCTQGAEEILLSVLSDGLIANREIINEFRKKAEDDKFTFEDYLKLIDLKFDDFTGKFFKQLLELVSSYLESKSSIVTMNDAESDLRDFCIRQGFDSPEEIYDTAGDVVEEDGGDRFYLSWELIDEGVSIEVSDESRKSLIDKIKSYYGKIITNKDVSDIIFERCEEFDKYFIRLGNDIPSSIRRKTVAVLDDKTDSDFDILFTTEGVHIIKRNKFKELVPYDEVKMTEDRRELYIDSEYTNGNVNMAELINLFEALTPDGEIKIHEPFDPIGLLGNLVKLPF